MKTQIIRLEPHDDIVSASDKMGWGQTARILIVWPETGQILNRRLDLVLMQRRSTTLGAQLILVSSNPRVRFHARQLRIPVFKSLRQAQNSHWRLERRYRRAQPVQTLERLKMDRMEPLAKRLPPHPQPASVSLHPAARLAFFAIGVLALLTMAAFLLPSAELELKPSMEIQDITINVQAKPGLSTTQLSGVVPMRLEKVVVEGRDQLPANGSLLLGSQPAVGQVQFKNLTGEPVSIPLGSGVHSLGQEAIRFVTTQSGEVPAGSGKVLTLPVQSLQPGSEGNLPAGSLRAVEGLLGTQVSVVNLGPTRGGRDQYFPAPNEGDRMLLTGQLLEALSKTALQELQNNLAPGDLLVSTDPELVRTLEKSFDPVRTEPADQLSLSLTLEFQAPVVLGDDLRSLAAAVLDANLPPGFSPLPDTLEIEHLTSPAAGNDAIISWKLRARRQLQAQISPAQAVQLCLGRSPAEAKQRLSAALPLQATPHITITPAWWPRMPVVPLRIGVNSDSEKGNRNH